MQVFDDQNKLSQDTCEIEMKNHVNKSISDYLLFNNYFECKGNEQKHLHTFVTDNINLHYKDGFGFTSPCFIDDDSLLRNKAIMTNDRERTFLCTRWYTAVPNLGKGGFIPNIESRLKQGEDTSDIKDCMRVTERDFNRFIPLRSCLANAIQNPDNIVEKWTRGGDFTRDYVRNDEYLEKCGFRNDGKMWRRA